MSSIIGTCSNLQVLQIYGNRINRIEGLEECPKITELALNDNLITQISGLENLVAL